MIQIRRFMQFYSLNFRRDVQTLPFDEIALRGQLSGRKRILLLIQVVELPL